MTLSCESLFGKNSVGSTEIVDLQESDKGVELCDPIPVQSDPPDTTRRTGKNRGGQCG
jgi:hypothetical protein